MEMNSRIEEHELFKKELNYRILYWETKTWNVCAYQQVLLL